MIPLIKTTCLWCRNSTFFWNSKSILSDTMMRDRLGKDNDFIPSIQILVHTRAHTHTQQLKLTLPERRRPVCSASWALPPGTCRRPCAAQHCPPNVSLCFWVWVNLDTKAHLGARDVAGRWLNEESGNHGSRSHLAISVVRLTTRVVHVDHSGHSRSPLHIHFQELQQPPFYQKQTWVQRRCPSFPRCTILVPAWSPSHVALNVSRPSGNLSAPLTPSFSICKTGEVDKINVRSLFKLRTVMCCFSSQHHLLKWSHCDCPAA